jgi:VWFA-related protein
MLQKLSLLLIALLLVAGLGYAQEQTPPQVTINSVDDTNFPTLRLFATVTDANGFPITGLKSADFQASLNGSPAQIISVANITDDALPISVVLVIDSSESMLGQPLADTKIAALAFLEKLRPGDEVAVLEFDSDITVAQGYTTDLEAVRSAIESIEADGRTALWDASVAAVDLAVQSSTGRRFVIFLSDGNEFGGLSSNGPEAGIEAADDNSVPFYTIGLGYGLDPAYITELATRSGGQVYIYPDSRELEQLYRFLSDRLRTQYVITLDSGLEPDGAQHQLTLQARDSAPASLTYTAIDLYPTVTIEGLPSDAISQPVNVTVTGEAPRNIQSARVTINEQPLSGVAEGISADVTEARFQQTFELDPYAYTPGDYTLTASVTDLEGGQREVTQTFSIAPLRPLVNVNTFADQAVISEPSAEIVVEVQASQTRPESVSIVVDEVTVGSVELGPNADLSAIPFTLEMIPLGPGPHRLQVVVNGPDGILASDSRTFTAAEELFITEFSLQGLSEGQTVSDPSLAFSLAIDESPLPIETATILVDDVEVASTPITDSTDLTNIPFSIDVIPLGAGPHTLQVDLSNSEGVIASDQVSFTVDETLYMAEFAVEGLQAGQLITTPTYEFTVALQPSVIPAESVEVSVNGDPIGTVEITPQTDLSAIPFTLDIMAIGPGEQDLTVTVNSAEGVLGSSTVPFEVDEALFIPTFTINGLEAGQTISDPTREISLSIASSPMPLQSAIFSVDGEGLGGVELEADSDLSDIPFTLEVLDFGPGEHTLEVNLQSDEGVVATEEVTFTVDPALFVTPTEVAQVVVPTNTPRPTNTPEPTNTPLPTETDTPMPTDTPQPTATLTALPTEEATEEASATPAPTDTPAPTLTNTPAPTDTPAEPRDVSVSEGEGGDGNALPLVGICIVLLILLAVVFFFLRRRNNETPPAK